MSCKTYTESDIHELVRIVDKKKDIINSFRPLNKIALIKIKDNFHIKGISNSLRIEGINFTERETRVLLDTLTMNDGMNKEAVETLNLNTAARYVESNLSKKLSIEFIKQLHFLCMANILKVEECGKFRNSGVAITQSQHIPPSSTKVKQLMTEAVQRYYDDIKSDKDILLSIFRFKHRFTHIHPFFDGNGRVSRLLLNFLLLKNKYVPVIIDADRRIEYYDSLEYADLYLDYRRFYGFILEELNNTYNMYLSIMNID